jgi:hypothetical protein
VNTPYEFAFQDMNDIKKEKEDKRENRGTERKRR